MMNNISLGRIFIAELGNYKWRLSTATLQRVTLPIAIIEGDT